MMLAVVARMVQPPLLVVAHTLLEHFRGGGKGPDQHGHPAIDVPGQVVQT
jgi:hypothetical protein